MSEPRVAIIGGGVAGVSVAYALAERGARHVTVVEAEHLGAGSSSLSVGMIETQYFEAVDVHARVIGRQFVDRLVCEEGLHFVRNGFLRPATNQTHLDLFEQSVAVQQRFDISDAEVLTPDGVARVAPPINRERIIGGLWRPSDGYLDGYLFTGLVAKLAGARGVKILQRHRLVGAKKTATSTWVLSFANGARLEADIVVNAAGSWASQTAGLLGLRVEIKPERHQALVIELAGPVDWVLPCVVDYIPGSHDDGLSVRHEGARQMFAMIHNEQSVLPASDPGSYNPRIDNGFDAVIVELILDRLPGLGDCVAREGWSGLYPMTRDGFPIVGPSLEDGTVFHAVGGCGSGIQIATAMGEVAADWILDGKSDRLVDGERWSPSRFSTDVAMPETK